jgi:1-pyrroline-5-carboxylate dehydrogenase
MATVPTPRNEPVRSYAPGTPERAEVKEALAVAAAEVVEVPIHAGAPRHTVPDLEVTMPHDHGHLLARGHRAGPEDVQAAIDAALEARADWARTSLEERAAVFLRAAELLAGPWRQRINAACMLGQSKTIHQSEIDAVCELADFWRCNVAFLEQIEAMQPYSPPGQWNRSEYRPLEGFVFAVTPFNFLSIAANIPTAPILCGNVAVWKPATATLLGCQALMALLAEAGLPPGVLTMVPGDGPEQGRVALDSPHLAGVHFTGSTATFHALWKGVAERLDRYRTFPRIVGETGGKDFIVAHESADPAALATAIVRGGFEYQGQKCSAASRIYVPSSRWTEVRDRIVADLDTIAFGDVRDFSNFGGAVIDERAFTKITDYVELGRRDGARVVKGGGSDRSKGWFVEPTLVQVDDPKHRLMREEIFGPVVSVYVYDEPFSEVLDLVDSTSPYGLTGAVFSRDRAAVQEARERLVQSAGNFYVNDKPTGAVVNQQPFGGGRQSGTNDKAGSPLNLLRWISPRSVKETFVPSTDYRYPFLAED